jgi:hypothetical protein
MPHLVRPRRSAARRVPLIQSASRPPLAEVSPCSDQPLFGSVLAWLVAVLPPKSFHRPACKRLAMMITGLLTGHRATTSSLAATIQTLHLTRAKELSIHRRIGRTEDDPDLDPARVLPAVFGSLLPTLLKSALAAHAANVGSGEGHHRRFVAVRVVLDASHKADHAVLLTMGLVYQGIVLPLGVRVWAQNETLPEGEFMTQVGCLISEIQAELPPDLRAHVLFLADRGFGSPLLLDLLASMGWHWILRVQDQVRIRLATGKEQPIRALAPAPGDVWGYDTDVPSDTTTPITAFKTGGWRACRVVAAWQVGRDEPWLLLTNLPASDERLHDYAQRWAIERLFLSWKSHGFDLEDVGIRAPARLGRLLTCLVLATLWRLAAAAPFASRELVDLARRTPKLTQCVLPLPEFPAAPLPAKRPWSAKKSLFTWGTQQFDDVGACLGTPELWWAFPDWGAPRWSQRCIDAYCDGVA